MYNILTNPTIKTRKIKILHDTFEVISSIKELVATQQYFKDITKSATTNCVVHNIPFASNFCITLSGLIYSIYIKV